MRTAVIGGSFNPPHIGHVHLIEQVLSSTDYQRIIIVPLHTPNHKSVKTIIDPAHRIEMVRLLAQNIKRNCIVDTCEIDRGGLSYTYETVLHLLSKYDDIDKIGIIMGDDLLPGLYQWYRFDELKDIVSFVIIRRDEEAEAIEQIISGLRADGVRIDTVDNVTIDASSSEIRDGIAAGKDVSRLLPDNVLSYIETHGLYRETT